MNFFWYAASGFNVEWAWFFSLISGEQLEAGAAVLVAVLGADLGEDAGHRLGADPPVHRSDRAVAAFALPDVGVILLLSGAAEQPGTGELLDPDRQAVLHLAGLDGHDRGAQRSGSGRAGVGHVVDRDAGLADLLLQLLPDSGVGRHQVPGGDDADVGHRHAGIGERAGRGLGREVDSVFVGMLAEFGHPDAEDPDVVASAHRATPYICGSSGRWFEAEADRLGSC